MYFTWVSVGTIDEAHREYVLSASLGRKKRSTETDKRKPRDQHKNGLDPKTGFDPPKIVRFEPFSPTKLICFSVFLFFFNPFATHPSAPDLSVFLALSSLFVPLSVPPFCAPLCALLCAPMSLPSLSEPPSCPPSCALSRASSLLLLSLPPLSLCPLSLSSLSVPLSLPSISAPPSCPPSCLLSQCPLSPCPLSVAPPSCPLGAVVSSHPTCFLTPKPKR